MLDKNILSSVGTQTGETHSLFVTYCLTLCLFKAESLSFFPLSYVYRSEYVNIHTYLKVE